MGAANVVPGVSGGTIAFITGIYETLINTIKSFDLAALKLAMGGRFKDLWAHVNGNFLVALGLGVLVGLVGLSKLLGFLFEHFQTATWAAFFGLILASIFFVGAKVKKWSAGVIVALLVGLVLAVAIALLKPAPESQNFIYLMLCGVVAVCSMIIPGLSGSFVLLLMGNYQLIMLRAVSDIPNHLHIILPVALGCAIGLPLFARLLSWIFKHYHDTAISLMTGFIAGSLLLIWPWKTPRHLQDGSGADILKDGEKIVTGYQWALPDFGTADTWIAFAFLLAGGAAVFAIETIGNRGKKRAD